MQDELLFRSSKYCGGVPITLCDGQAWALAVPQARFVLDDTDPDGIKMIFVLPNEDPNHKYQTLVDAFHQAKKDFAIIRSQLDLGAALLKYNYDLTNQQISDLLQFSYVESPPIEMQVMKKLILEVAFGQVPKPSEDGSSLPLN